ncbi:iron uptake porin [Aetokthonos hydrillicola Thurmond2011]|uniref:Iron uptake porin n=1 Tax=Aetokthonos hydrillicola Thurmond2011 TaxID=2712845 RepID=A0AAP5M557_9CYAN|nr:iron uptake porin [Aetokthonos hydrillicola]MBW4583769.1 iron uptake porin [Aetokthonos hydrillicola CCALA 1050]MDR9895536.1 iron uptake porin [Aetokthonos hydrillicola Thurmond2011]
MKKPFWNFLKLSPLVLAATFCLANSALAAEVNKAETNSVTKSSSDESLGNVTSVSRIARSSEDNIGQVTSVSQFSDVQPTDWAFQSLQSLVERYGCIAGYPNGTYRGNRAMTRYEFAAGLNACLDRVNELIATATADVVKKEDLATLQRLQEEFAAELATLRGRVDALEARTAELEANQFSTTTKLVGEAIFSISDAFGETRAVGSQTILNDPGRTRPGSARVDRDSNVTFSDRVRLSLNSSFTGKDRLQIRLQAGNVAVNSNNTAYGAASTGTQMSRLAYDGFDSNQNSVVIDKINYAFDLKDAIRVKVDANVGEFYENVETFNPDFASSGKGALSRYGRFSPIYRQGQGGAGATISFAPKGPISASIGYLGGGRGNLQSNPTQGSGLFNGNYAALGQLTIKPTQAINIGLTYARTFQNPTGGVNVFESTGSALASQPFGNASTTGNHFGLEGTLQLGKKITLAGWGGYSQLEAVTGFAGTARTATAVGTPAVAKGSQAEAYYYGATLSLKDFGKQGNVLGFIFGVPPKISYSDVRFAGTDGVVRRQRDRDTTYQLEGQYKFQVNDNISITPGVIVLFNPEHNNRNDNEYVGTLRTTFTF